MTAQWTATSYGTKIERTELSKGWNPHPWVRELTRGPRGEQQVRWLEGRRDYTNVHPDGASGIATSFTLRHGTLYQAACVVHSLRNRQVWPERRRMYLWVTAEGDVKMLTEEAEEVQAWLAAG